MRANELSLRKVPDDFAGLGIGGNVKIFRNDPEQPVANAAAYKVGLMTGAAQLPDDIESKGLSSPTQI
jgi:hypothetical protein